MTSLSLKSFALAMTAALSSGSLVAQDLPDDMFFEPDRPTLLESKFLPSGHLLVRPLVNDEESAWWILDTGAGRSTIDPEAADALGMEAYGNVVLQGVGGTEAGRIRRGETFRLGAMVYDEPTFVEMQCDFLTKNFHHEIAGICGFDVFSRAVVTFDRKRKEIGIHDPETYELPEHSQWEELQLQHNHPCVKARFEGDREGLFTLDTGAGNSSVTFHKPAVDRLALLEGRDVKESAAGGVGGHVKTMKGQIEYFEIGGRRFDNPYVEFATEAVGAFGRSVTDGNLGGHFLTPFTVVFDYQNHRIAFVELQEE